MKKKVLEIPDAQERTLTEISQFKDETKQMADILTLGIVKILTRSAYEPEDHLWRQMGVRVLFSLIETLCYRLKQLIILNGDFLKFKLGEIVCLEEKSFRVNKKGIIEKRKAYPDMTGNIKFVFQMMAKLISSDFKIDLESRKWKSFQSAVKIRHRITHPKNPSDLEVSLQDYKVAGDSYHWFVKCYNQLIEDSKEYFQSRRIS